MSHGIESLKSLFSSDLSIVTILQRLYSSWSDSAFEGLLGSVPVPPILDSAAYYVSEVLKSDLIPVRLHYVRLQELSLARAVLCIALAPLIWNLVARMEYHTRLISRVVGRKIGAYLLATWIFCFSLYRDALFLMAIEDQPRIAALQETPCVVLGSASYLWGMLLVLSSMARLGILGTYLGDYFGFLLDGKVESFPFNLFDNPMYVYLFYVNNIARLSLTMP